MTLRVCHSPQATDGVHYNLPSDPATIAGWAIVEGLVLVYHNIDGELPSSRVEELLHDLDQVQFTHVLAYGHGGAKISAVHRKRLADITKGVKIATIVDNAVTRGIVTAMGWFGIKIKSFPRKDIRKAIEYLEVPGLEPDWIESEAQRLEDECNRFDKVMP